MTWTAGLQVFLNCKQAWKYNSGMFWGIVHICYCIYVHNNSQHTMQVANDTRDLGDWLRTLSFHLEHFGALQIQNPKPDQLLLSIKQVFLNPLVGKNAKCEPRNHRGRGDRSIWKEKLLLRWPCLGVSHMTLARTPSISATAPCQWWKWRMNIGSQGMILSTSNTSRWQPPKSLIWLCYPPWN